MRPQSPVSSLSDAPQKRRRKKRSTPSRDYQMSHDSAKEAVSSDGMCRRLFLQFRHTIDEIGKAISQSTILEMSIWPSDSIHVQCKITYWSYIGILSYGTSIAKSPIMVMSRMIRDLSHRDGSSMCIYSISHRGSNSTRVKEQSA